MLRAFFGRQAAFLLNVEANWDAQADDEANIAWVRDVWERIQPHIAGGVYVNELGEDEGLDRVALAYGDNLSRLARIKAAYDPTNPDISDVRIIRADYYTSFGNGVAYASPFFLAAS